jgi:glycosyltransferase involved in cell wall biosynthesis
VFICEKVLQQVCNKFYKKRENKSFFEIQNHSGQSSMNAEWPKDTYVLVPSYKSIGQLRPFLNSLAETVPKEYICVVDDASGDGTYEFCKGLGIDCVRHNRNRGKGAALRTGFSHIIGTKNIDADVKWILTMDADGQHSPADIPRFIDESRRHPDLGICIGARSMRLGAMPPARILSNRLTSFILSILTGRRIIDSQSGYRLYSADFVKSAQIEHNRFQAESELIQKAAAKHFLIRFTRVRTLYLDGGASHISHLLDTPRWVAAVLRVWFKLTFKGF